MTSQDVLVADQLNYSYNGVHALHDISMKLEAGTRCVLVGANGAGKSTLLRLFGGKHLITPNTSCLTIGKVWKIDFDGVYYSRRFDQIIWLSFWEMIGVEQLLLQERM